MLQAQPCPSRVRPVPAVSLRIWPLTLEPGQRFLQRSNRQPFQVVHLPCKPSLINTVLNCTTPLRCFLIVCSLFYCAFLIARFAADSSCSMNVFHKPCCPIKWAERDAWSVNTRILRAKMRAVSSFDHSNLPRQSV